MIEVIPAILARDMAEFAAAKKRLDGISDWLQIDLTDGEFTGNRTVTPEDLSSEAYESSLELHLMVKGVGEWVDRAASLGARRILVPVETATELTTLSEKVHQSGAEFGLSINPETDLEKVRPAIGSCDRLLLLSVQPGYQGQGFIPETLDRLRTLRGENPDIPIEVDGGITAEVIPELAAAGATALVVGHDLIVSDDPAEELRVLEKAAEAAEE